MKRKKKKYSRPRKPFDKIRIDEENVLKEKYGLKNKKEIWKADAAIGRIRSLAKKLINKSEEEQNVLIGRLKIKGFDVDDLADVLALGKEDWLKRRLQTVVVLRKLANTPRQARQFIVHKHISVGGQVVNIPSYQVSVKEEPDIKLDIVLNTLEKSKSKIEKIKDEVLEDNSVEKVAEDSIIEETPIQIKKETMETSE